MIAEQLLTHYQERTGAVNTGTSAPTQYANGTAARGTESMTYLTNMGQPYIFVVDANYRNAGELYLAHKHNGLDIEVKFAVDILKNVQHLWGRPVHLQAMIDDDMMLFSFDGKQSQQQKVHEDLPKPAHQV